MAAKTKDELKGIGMLTADMRSEIANTILSTKENFICLTGGRGVGKSYTVQKTIIEYCYQNDNDFILVVETREAKDSGALREWLSKVTYEQFPEYDFKYTTDFAYMKHAHKEEDWKRIGICIPLRKATSYKRNSYPHTRFMIMDEAMLEDGQYIDIYMDYFLTIYHTADRDRNVVKAIIMGNTMQKINPIYEFFEIGIADLTKVGLVKRTFNRYLWYLPMPPDLVDENTNDFRKMIKGTKYGDMANGYFQANYGHLIQEPYEDAIVTSAYGLCIGDNIFVQLLVCNDGYVYAECVNEEHMRKYCKAIYTTTYTKATKDNPRMPPWLAEAIKTCLNRGALKFITEESLLVLNMRFKNILGVKIL